MRGTVSAVEGICSLSSSPIAAACPRSNSATTTLCASNLELNFFSSITHDLQWRLQVDLAILPKQRKMLQHRNLITTSAHSPLPHPEASLRLPHTERKPESLHSMPQNIPEALAPSQIQITPQEVVENYSVALRQQQCSEPIHPRR